MRDTVAKMFTYLTVVGVVSLVFWKGGANTPKILSSGGTALAEIESAAIGNVSAVKIS